VKAFARATQGIKAEDDHAQSATADSTSSTPRSSTSRSIRSTSRWRTAATTSSIDSAAPFKKEIGYGVLDVHSHRNRNEGRIKEGILRGLEVLKPEQMYVDPDLRLKTRTVEEAFAKLEGDGGGGSGVRRGRRASTA